MESIPAPPAPLTGLITILLSALVTTTLSTAPAAGQAATLAGTSEKATSETAPPRIDLQKELDQVVALNNGFGGGIFRVASGSQGILWEGASGETVYNRAAMPVDATLEIASV